MSKVDKIDNVCNLLALIEHYIGKDSVTYSEAIRLLKDGHEASDIAKKLGELAKEAWADG